MLAQKYSANLYAAFAGCLGALSGVLGKLAGSTARDELWLKAAGYVCMVVSNIGAPVDQSKASITHPRAMSGQRTGRRPVAITLTCRRQALGLRSPP